MKSNIFLQQNLNWLFEKHPVKRSSVYHIFTEFLFNWNSYLRGVLHTKLSPKRLNQDRHWLCHYFSSNLILFLTYLNSALTPLCQHTKYCILIRYIHSTNSSNRKLQSSMIFFQAVFPQQWNNLHNLIVVAKELSFILWAESVSTHQHVHSKERMRRIYKAYIFFTSTWIIEKATVKIKIIIKPP